MTSPIPPVIPSVRVQYAANGAAARSNALGMRPMQERVWQHRGEPYLLIKSPPASGKSRALMFVALDKLLNQGLKQALIVVPEKTIGASFHDEPLSKYGFFADWHVKPRWNLCNAPGTEDGGKVKALEAFLQSDDRALICTHATFRFAVERLGIEAFDNRLIAVDEFHHVSSDKDNKLGAQLAQFIARDKVHLAAMTGSYFRGDAQEVLSPEDEARFCTVTYTYYEQLSSYTYLKELTLDYCFYAGGYCENILRVLDPLKKTIVHIPNVNSRESTGNKYKEVEAICEALGQWEGQDEKTGFQLVRLTTGRVLRIADLVDDEPARRDRVAAALKDPAQKNNRDHVDIIIALGMAKEGFDWIWCEHALTIGYKSSLTEVVQIIGRATRDAPGKTRARFTNLIAEPDADSQLVAEAVNDTLKAIAASLLMEQVLAPRLEFRAKRPGNAPSEGYDYGEQGYDPAKTNVGVNAQSGAIQMEIAGLKEPQSEQAQRICQQDLNELVARFVQDKPAMEKGMFDDLTLPQELTVLRMGKIVRDRYPELSEGDQEAVRQHAVAALAVVQQAKAAINQASQTAQPGGAAGSQAATGQTGQVPLNTAFVDGVRRFALSVKELDIDLIDGINPFGEAYAIASKTMNESTLRAIEAVIAKKKMPLDMETATALTRRAVQFKQDWGRPPSSKSANPWEHLMIDGVNYVARAGRRHLREGAGEDKEAGNGR